MPEGLGPVVSSAQQNMTAFIAERTNMGAEGVDKMLGHPSVQREYTARVKRGWDKREALEDALMEVFSGGMTRPLRIYNGLATDKNVKIVEGKIAGRSDSVTIAETVPDMLELRSLVKDCDDPDRIGRLIAAETAGRNSAEKLRPAALDLLMRRLNHLSLEQDPDAPPVKAPAPSSEELEDLQED